MPECGVCLTETPIPHYTLPCQHSFCSFCIASWRETKGVLVCPLCKISVDDKWFDNWLSTKLSWFNVNGFILKYNQRCQQCKFNFKFIPVLKCGHFICPSCIFNFAIDDIRLCPYCLERGEKIEIKKFYEFFGYKNKFY